MPPWTRPPDDPFILAALEAERQSVVEPWRPQLNDFVRVRLSGECPYFHGDLADGRIGVVRCFITQAELDYDLKPGEERSLVDPGHFYIVDFPTPVHSLERALGCTSHGSDMFAASELVLVARLPTATPAAQPDAHSGKEAARAV